MERLPQTGHWSRLSLLLASVFLLSLDARLLFGSELQRNELVAKWNSWAESVKSVEAKGYKCVLNMVSPNNRFSHEDVEELVFRQLAPLAATSCDDVNIEILQSLTQPIIGDPARKTESERQHGPRGLWRPFSIIDDTKKLRADEVLGHDDFTTVRAHGGEVQYRASPKTATVSPFYSQLLVEGRDLFLFRLRGAAVNQEWTIKRSSDSGYVMEAENRQVVSDSSGFVSRYSVFGSKSPIRLHSELIRALPITLTTNQVPFPRLIADVMYFDDTGGVRALIVHIVTDVHVNREIPADRFNVSVPAGTLVINRAKIDAKLTARMKETMYRTEKVTSPVQDVRGYADRAEFGVR